MISYKRALAALEPPARLLVGDIARAALLLAMMGAGA